MTQKFLATPLVIFQLHEEIEKLAIEFNSVKSKMDTIKLDYLFNWSDMKREIKNISKISITSK
jgi:hypothetical protein